MNLVVPLRVSPQVSRVANRRLNRAVTRAHSQRAFQQEFRLVNPSSQPSAQPSGVPTGQPSAAPQCVPTSAPTNQPSSQPPRVCHRHSLAAFLVAFPAVSHLVIPLESPQGSRPADLALSPRQCHESAVRSADQSSIRSAYGLSF